MEAPIIVPAAGRRGLASSLHSRCTLRSSTPARCISPDTWYFGGLLGSPPFSRYQLVCRPVDWYLQHLELVMIVPALIAGYVNVSRFAPALVGKPVWDTRFDSAITWAWCVPALVLSYRMLQYHAPSSVLFGGSMTSIKYFFDIQKVMPTWANPLVSDPTRVAAQMFVTAPFYAGVAYSVGALASRYELLTKLFTFDKHE
jgi:hypothetical protein